MEQINAQKDDSHCTAKPADIINWMIAQQPSELSDRSIEAIRRTLHDPVKALEVALLKAKHAKANNEEIDIKALMNFSSPKPKRRKKNETASI